MLALILGIKSNLNHEQLKLLQNTGLSHAISISGLHIGLISLFSYYFFISIARLNKSIFVFFNNFNKSIYHLALMFSWIISIVYFFISGMQVPTIRAIVMLSFFMLNKLCLNNISSVLCLAVSIIIILLINPLSVLSAAFWLSYGAVFVLIYKKFKLN